MSAFKDDLDILFFYSGENIMAQGYVMVEGKIKVLPKKKKKKSPPNWKQKQTTEEF